MENLWILYVIIYGLLKGSREGFKKAALKKNGPVEILFFFTLTGFILAIPFSQNPFGLAPSLIFWIFIKSAVICIAWIFAYKALRNMSVSLYGIMDLSRMVFSTLLGVFVLGENFTLQKFAGLVLVLLGLTLANLKKNTETKGMTAVVLASALINCFLNSVSGTMDKILMQYMDSSQLQFWFMLFMTTIYGGILIATKEKVNIKNVGKNLWIPLMSISLVLGDKLLFEANADPASEVTLMTIIKQCSVLVTVLTGWIFFKEKHILYKLLCTAIVLSGIFISIL